AAPARAADATAGESSHRAPGRSLPTCRCPAAGRRAPRSSCAGRRRGTARWCLPSSDLQGLRLLALVRMRRTGVDPELLAHLAAQSVLRQHPLDRELDDPLGMLLDHAAERDQPLATRVAAVPEVRLLVGLVAGQPHLLGVDDDDVVAGVQVRGVDGLVLAAQDAGDVAGEPAEDLALGVDDPPAALDVVLTGCVCLHSHPGARYSGVQRDSIL